MNLKLRHSFSVVLLMVVCGAVVTAWFMSRRRAAPATISVGTLNAEIKHTRDCGPACLYVIGKLESRVETLDDLRKLTKVDARGTSMLNLKHAAEQLGFKTDARRGSFNYLRDSVSRDRVYAVLYLPQGHFILAVAALDGDRVSSFDPATGIGELDEERLRGKYGWRGEMLLITCR